MHVPGTMDERELIGIPEYVKKYLKLEYPAVPGAGSGAEYGIPVIFVNLT